MARGRKAIPSPLKLLRNNPGKRPLPRGEPQPARDLPTPPAHLGALAVLEWERVAPELHRIGVLTMVDRAVLAGYCDAYERWALARQVIEVEGLFVSSPNGYRIAHPALSVANTAKATMLKYMIELGLTPASRVKLAKGEPKVDDPLEQFLTTKKPKR